MNVENCAAIVTGGASGLGEATAQKLVRMGAKVALFDMNAALGSDVARKIGAAFMACDITSEQGVIAALDAAEALNGKARILINCAGIGVPAKAVDRDGVPQPLTSFQKIVTTNLVGTFNMASKFAARAMTLQPIGEERGVIVSTASVAAFDGQIGQAAYAASKSGIVGMTLPLAREFARSAIRVVTIAPGLFMTPLFDTLSQPARDALASQVPFPSRLGYPEEYADLVEAILRNPMLNGETIRLDGAIRMAPK